MRTDASMRKSVHVHACMRTLVRTHAPVWLKVIQAYDHAHSYRMPTPTLGHMTSALLPEQSFSRLWICTRTPAFEFTLQLASTLTLALLTAAHALARANECAHLRVLRS
eukprot:6214263-Pleurochrysis_carterae.AAC.5